MNINKKPTYFKISGLKKNTLRKIKMNKLYIKFYSFILTFI